MKFSISIFMCLTKNLQVSFKVSHEHFQWAPLPPSNWENPPGGKLITDFRLTQDGYEAVDLISIIPDEIKFNDFLKELLDYFEKIHNYIVNEKEGIFVITLKEVREDRAPVCKITVSAYPNKCKLTTQAFSSNLRKFSHGF